MIDIFRIILAVIFVLVMIAYIKLYVTYYHYGSMIDAIYAYSVKCLFNDDTPYVDYNDMKDMDHAWLNIFDWGYKRIVPKTEYAILKPYIVPFTISDIVFKTEKEKAIAKDIYKKIVDKIDTLEHPRNMSTKDYIIYAFALGFIDAKTIKLLRKYYK